MDEYASIKILSQKGNGIKQIPMVLKLSRNTVRKALRSDSFKNYIGDKKDDISKSSVVIYHEKILEMLIKDKFIGSRIFDEIKKLGYLGSKTSFYEYFAKDMKQIQQCLPSLTHVRILEM